ncbi:MAG: hypothetical protein HY927_05355 [Elusimicrobia bacterium]|nr:hypothetical protein [Elusimicrobiota bacterium]
MNARGLRRSAPSFLCLLLLADALTVSAQVRAVSPKLQTGGAIPAVSYGAVRSNPTVGSAPALSLSAGRPLPMLSGGGTPKPETPGLGSPFSLPAVPGSPVVRGEAAVLPAQVPGAVAPVAQAPTSVDELHAMAAQLAAPAESADGSLGRRFDGSAALGDAVEGPESIEAETVTREVAEGAPETMDLWMSGKGIKKPVVKSDIYGTLRVVRGPGSRRYWEKFQKGTPVRILLGNSTLFVSRVEGFQIKKVKQLTKRDLEGIIPLRTLRSKNIGQLRRAVIADLRARELRAAAYGTAASVITEDSEVSLVKFMSYGEARALPENSDNPTAEPRVRKPVAIPAALSGIHKYLPKIVLLDMRTLQGPLSYDLIEDIGKLMKAGVYFVLLSEKPVQGPGSIEEQLTKGLTSRQRDQITRYKLFSLGLGGNEFAGYEGRFPKSLSFARFEWRDIDIMKHVAATLGGGVLQSFAKEMVFSLPQGADAQAFAARFEAELRKFAVPSSGYSLSMGRAKGKPAMIVRPHSLTSALPALLEALREDENLYANESDLMVISRDEGVLKALPRAVKPVEHSPGLQGADLAEMALAAMLGSYRENLPGDFAASASKIASFQKDKYRLGGDFYNIFMFMGHVIHASFNWAVWTYRNTGVFPDADAMVAQAQRIWGKADAERTRNLINKSGQSMGDHRSTMELRVRTMHAMVADLVTKYPIVIGTELPNLRVFERFKKGQVVARDVLRLVYDFVVARETPEGLELLVVDFKTGQSKTNQTLDKDVQVQLYDLVPRLSWKDIGVPYGVTGALKKVAKVGVVFVFTSEMKEARLTEWTRLKYEKFLRSVVNRMRKHSQPAPAPAKDKKKTSK